MQIIGIIGAMEIEIENIIKNLNEIIKIKVAGQYFYKGKIKDKQVIVTCSGIGKVNAAISCQILITQFHVKAIINTGIAGNMSDELKIGDVVISDKVKYHDFDDELLKMYYPYTSHFETNILLKELAIKSIQNLEEKSFNYKSGLIVTGDIFLQDKNRKAEIKNLLNPLCIEMEGSAIAHCCSKNNIPFLIVRSISDNSEDDAEEIYENFKETVAKTSSSLVFEIIKNIPN